MGITFSENYKISKDRSLKILMLISFISFFGFGFLTKFSFENYETYALDINKMMLQLPYNFQQYYVFIVIFSGILAGTYVVSEFDKGTIRNALSTGTSKLAYYFSKLYSQLLACTVLAIISIFTFSVSTMIFIGWNNVINSHFILNFFVFFLVLLIHLFTYSCLFLMIAFLVRGVGGVIAICLVYTMVESLIAQLLVIPKIKILNTIVENMSFSILSNLSEFANTDTILTANFAKTLIPAFIIIILTTFIGLITFIKRDVK